MTATVSPATDGTQRIGEQESRGVRRSGRVLAGQQGERAAAWPAWSPPAGAVVAWLELQAAVRLMGRAPACERDPEAWWLRGRLPKADAERAAAAVEACSWCPVRGLCAAYAVAAGETDGIWGGLTPAERKAARQ